MQREGGGGGVEGPGPLAPLDLPLRLDRIIPYMLEVTYYWDKTKIIIPVLGFRNYFTIDMKWCRIL